MTRAAKARPRVAILALDLGLTLGWGVRDERGQITSGFELLAGARRNESAGMSMLRFRGWLRDALEKSRATLVAYERPILYRARLGAAHTAHNIEGVLLAELQEAEVDHVSVPPAAIKKHATGKGNSKKPEVRAAVAARLGRAIESEDEADALAVLGWAMDEVGEGQAPAARAEPRTKKLFQEGS